MTGEEAAKYIGHEWEAGANGPDKWDCWHFLMHVLATYFHKTLPEAPIGDHDGCRSLYASQMRTGKWQIVDLPQHGDCVSMREGDWPHVGIYLDIDGGKILHCCEGHGVIATRPKQLRSLSFGRVKYYRIVE